jgi:hypothetical protein
MTTSPFEKPPINLLQIRYWYWKGKRKSYGESWAVSVWDTPEDLQAYGKRAINRLTNKHKIKQGKGPFITEVDVIRTCGRSQLSLAQHRDQYERHHF